MFYYFDDEKLLIELCVDHGILTLPLYKTILGVGGASNPIFSTGYTLLFTLREMKDERTISGEMMRRGERLSPPEQIICLFSGSTGAYAEADHTTFDEIKCSMQVCKSVISILKCDLLIIDDMGLKSLPDRAGEILFELIMRRYELRSTIMTSNRPIEDWGKLIGDVATAGAILDRLLQNAMVIPFKGRSYRLRKAAGEL